MVMAHNSSLIRMNSRNQIMRKCNGNSTTIKKNKYTYFIKSDRYHNVPSSTVMNTISSYEYVNVIRVHFFFVACYEMSV